MYLFFNVPPTAKVIWILGHSLKTRLTEALVNKESGLCSTPQWLLTLKVPITTNFVTSFLILEKKRYDISSESSAGESSASRRFS